MLLLKDKVMPEKVLLSVPCKAKPIANPATPAPAKMVLNIFSRSKIFSENIKKVITTKTEIILPSIMREEGFTPRLSKIRMAIFLISLER